MKRNKNMKKRNVYLEIFISFFKVGLFTFGGGYAMLPIAKKEIVENKKWITEEELIDYYSIAQLSIGILAINTNALIGYHVAKKKGATIAAIATAIPSIIIIILIASFLSGIFDNPIVANMFSTIRIVVAALITSTTYDLARKGIIDIFGLILFLTSFILMITIRVNPIFLIIPSALLGVIFFPFRKKVQS